MGFWKIEADYKTFGVTDQDGDLYYKGEKVRFFVDNRSRDAAKFSGTVHDGAEGVYYLKTVRDANGNLIDINEIDVAEAEELAFWRG